MKKFISMFAFAAMIVLGAFAFASCGGDDDNDDPTPTPTPTPTESSSYKFTVEVKNFESAKALYPDLAMTYTIPGMEAKTVTLTSTGITVDEKTSKAGKVAIVFKGKLDRSKVDPEKKYSLDFNIVYDIKADTYRKGTDNPHISTITGQELMELYSDLSEAVDLSVDL